VCILYVEYAEREKEYGILFIFSLFCEYMHLEYVRIHAIYRVNQAEYVIHILVVASQEYVNIYSTRRVFNEKQVTHTHTHEKNKLTDRQGRTHTQTHELRTSNGATAAE